MDIPTSSTIQDIIKSAYELSPFVVFMYLFIELNKNFYGLLALISIFVYSFKINYFSRLKVILFFKYPDLKNNPLKLGNKYFELMLKDKGVWGIFLSFFTLYITNLIILYCNYNLEYSKILFIYSLIAIVYFSAMLISKIVIVLNYQKEIPKMKF